MKNNKGFSLVELIIVVAIMAIMGGFIFMSFGLLTGQDARKCANNLSTVLDKEKNYALAKSAEADCYVEISLTSDGYFAEYYVPKKAVGTDVVSIGKEEIGKASVMISCYYDDGSGTPSLKGTLSGGTLKIVYNRVSGAIKEINLNGTTDINMIRIDKGRTYEINIFTATGKHTLERKN